MSDNLLPCPFCGGEATVYASFSLPQFKVNCKKCRAQTAFHDSRQYAVDFWNTRATPPLMQVTESGAQIVGEWRPIADAPKDELILYYPAKPNKRGMGLSPMIRVDRYPVCHPRQPTHWRPLPPPPAPPKEEADAL